METGRKKTVPSGRIEARRRAFVVLKVIYKDIESSGRLTAQQYARFEDIVRGLLDEFSNRTVHPNYLLRETAEEADWIYNDAINTALLTFWYCRAAGFAQTDQFEFTLGGLLHDIGHCLSDQMILQTRSRLKDETMLPMQMHPQSGYTLLKAVAGVPEPVLQAVLFHHERYDGEGYPTTLPYERLPLSLKIVGVADAFEAMINDRPYRKRLSHQEALRQLLGMADRNFEFEIVEGFIRLLGAPFCDELPFYKEAQLARTSRGELGQVLAVGEDWLRPRLRLLVDAERRLLARPREIDLSEDGGRLAQVFTTAESQKILATLRAKQAAAG